MMGCGKDFLMKTFLYIVITIKFKLILIEPREATSKMSNKTRYYEHLDLFQKNWIKSKTIGRITENAVIRPM